MMTDAVVADQIDRADHFIGQLREAGIATVVDPASLCADEQRRVSYCGFSRRCHFGHQRRAALIAPNCGVAQRSASRANLYRRRRIDAALCNGLR